MPFKDNEIEGILKVYYKTGELEQEVTFEDGKAIKGFIYTKDGKKTKMTNAHIYNMGLKY